MKDFGSLAQGSRYYKHSELLMTSVVLGFVLKALDAMNESRLWLILMTLGHELKVVNEMSFPCL